MLKKQKKYSHILLMVLHILVINEIKISESFSNLRIEITERRQRRHSGIFIVKFKHTSHIFLLLLLLTLNK